MTTFYLAVSLSVLNMCHYQMSYTGFLWKNGVYCAAMNHQQCQYHSDCYLSAEELWGGVSVFDLVQMKG